VDRRYIYLTCCAFHLFIIFLASCRDTFWLLAQGYSFLPRSLDTTWGQAQNFAGSALGEHLSFANPVRQFVAAYAHCAGIQSGYAYFAPNVPDSYKIVFELHYPDGRTELELPRVGAAAAGLRLTALLHEIGENRSDRLRGTVIKMLAESVWRDHPEATSMLAVFGHIKLPTTVEFMRGETESYRVVYAYDFSLKSRPPAASKVP
jgi:hypothetical protein